MARRVFEIAKELDVKSKAIVEKCKAEGIPAITNHMSSVSVGLEATIKDWFASGSASGTAVETADKVDIAKARSTKKSTSKKAAAKKPAAKKAASKKTAAKKAASAGGEAESDGGGTAVAVEEPPTVEALDTVVSVESKPESEAAASETGTSTAAESSRGAGTGGAAAAAAAPGDDEAGSETDGEGGDSGTGAASPAAPKPPAPLPSKPRKIVMNVPERPDSVTPAGPTIKDVKKTPAKLSGPKVVRVEAPERLEQPRPRRQGPGGGGFGGPRGGGAMSPQDFPPAMPGQDGRGRRGKRRGGEETGGDRDRPARGGQQGGGGAFRYQDLVEREERLSRAGGFLRQRRREKSKGQTVRAESAAQVGGTVKIQAPFTIKDLSAATGVKGGDIVKKLFLQGVVTTINSPIEVAKAEELMLDWNIELEVTEQATGQAAVVEEFEKREVVSENSRSPVVTILGHVDHGKTSLLDRIRNANVAEGEAGGITQATSAFLVDVAMPDGTQSVCFLDTPGHEAFTEMRSRGAQMTDIIVLVIAADDGVMPQTVESISHAKAADVPILVALNKIDLPGADNEDNVQRIYGQLAEHGLNPTAWGGDTEVIKLSAMTGQGVDTLLETLALTAEILELKADFGGNATGVVIESQMQEGRGATANVLVQQGEMSVGQFIVAGRAFGRVRDMTGDRGQKVTVATPSTPIQISGIDQLPEPGDKFYVVKSLKLAEQAAEQYREEERQRQLAQPKATLDTMFAQMKAAEQKELLVVLKADVQGSIDAIKKSIEQITTDEIRVRVLHTAVGGVTESDVTLASASGAIIFGFNVIPSAKARKNAEEKGVEIRAYRVIYDIIDDVKAAASGLLSPEVREEVLGHAEVRQVFKVSKVGAIAGCYVTDGSIERNAFIRVTRDDIVIEQDRVLEQLKRFKDDAKEVKSGQECGMKIQGYDDIKEGDILECFRKVEVAREL